ncbi:hypothetical protein D9M71_646960 [compost metagenome]
MNLEPGQTPGFLCSGFLGLQTLPFSIHRTLRAAFARIQVGEPEWIGLVPSRDRLLLAILFIAVGRGNAGVLDTLLDQVLNTVLVGQLGLKIQAGGEAVGGEAVAQIAPQPDDGVDFCLNPKEAIGLIGGKLRSAFGQAVAQRCSATL